MSPQFFERLVVELLLAMGYGGSLSDAGKAIGQSGDGGIDGIIKEDKLGLDVIYIQAKRWDGVVGRPEIHKFVGALAGKRASKGVFITTSSFTKFDAAPPGALNSRLHNVQTATARAILSHWTTRRLRFFAVLSFSTIGSGFACPRSR